MYNFRKKRLGVSWGGNLTFFYFTSQKRYWGFSSINLITVAYIQKSCLEHLTIDNNSIPRRICLLGSHKNSCTFWLKYTNYLYDIETRSNSHEHDVIKVVLSRLSCLQITNPPLTLARVLDWRERYLYFCPVPAAKLCNTTYIWLWIPCDIPKGCVSEIVYFNLES